MSNINDLAWQLRAGVLMFNNGHVEPHEPSIQTNTKGHEIIIARCQQINKIIDQNMFKPSNMEDLINYFNELENQDNGN